jgi:hypothetical protein
VFDFAGFLTVGLLFRLGVARWTLTTQDMAAPMAPSLERLLLSVGPVPLTVSVLRRRPDA